MSSQDPRESPAHAALYVEEFVRWAPNVPGAASHMRRAHEEAVGLAAYTYFARLLEKVVIM